MTQDVRSRFWEEERNQQIVANGIYQLYAPHPQMRRNSWYATRSRASSRVIQ